MVEIADQNCAACIEYSLRRRHTRTLAEAAVVVQPPVAGQHDRVSGPVHPDRVELGQTLAARRCPAIRTDHGHSVERGPVADDTQEGIPLAFIALYLQNANYDLIVKGITRRCR